MTGWFAVSPNPGGYTFVCSRGERFSLNPNHHHVDPAARIGTDMLSPVDWVPDTAYTMPVKGASRATTVASATSRAIGSDCRRWSGSTTGRSAVTTMGTRLHLSTIER